MSPSQCRAARGLVDISQADLAQRAGVGLSTVRNFEAGRSIPIANNLDAMRRALESAGAQFIPENGGGAGVRLSKRDGVSRRGPVAALEAVLAAFAQHQLPKAMEQERVEDLRFVRAGPQATLMEGVKPIGLVTLLEDKAIFKPPLPTEQIGEGHELTQEDVWIWVIAAWKKSRAGRSSSS